MCASAMLSIARLRPATAAGGYYERAARADADWQSWTGVPASEWVGAARTALAREGPVEAGELTRLLLGIDPVTGRTLRRPAPAHNVVRLHLDPATGRLYPASEPRRPVAGFDLVFSAPKSISLLLAISDERAPEVADAHRIAWRDALGLLETHACVVRRRGEHLPGTGFIGAAFAHYTNRDGDPHLHTHVVIANQALADDDPDRWRALDAVPLLIGWRWAARSVYEARLRHELTMRFGVEWSRSASGGLELAAVSRAAISATSRRTAAVRAHAEQFGVRTAHGARIAAQATRPARQAFAAEVQRAGWRETASLCGLDESAKRRLFAGGREPTPCDHRRTDLDLFGPEGLTATRHSFTHAEVIAAWADAAIDGTTAQAVLARADRTIAHPEVAELGAVRRGRPRRYTTQKILSCEATVITRAEAGRGAAAHRALPEDLATAITCSPIVLSNEQILAVEHAAAPADQVACIVGRAGSGKTTALAAATRALWASGIPVTGCAPSAQAAHVLQDATGMPSWTMHALCSRWDAGTDAPSGCVIVDEASMADTRTLERLLTHADAHHARIVLVGDHKQLPAVGPGGLFAELTERLGAVELVANHRQASEWEQSALAALRDGRSAVALEALAAHGCLHLSTTPIDACAQAWWQAQVRDPSAQVLMIAFRRSEVAALNRQARRHLEAAGRRGARIGDADREFAVGDWVRCRINDPREGLRNGMRAEVSAVDSATGIITLDIDDGTRVDVSEAYQRAGGVEHAWAITGHAAQGISVDRSFVVAPGDGAHAEWGYVALSRARAGVHLFVGDTPDEHPIDALARSLRTSVAWPCALAEIALSRQQAAHALPDPPPPQLARGGPDRTPHHKATLTRDRELGR